MQHMATENKEVFSCFYLANSRQMQQQIKYYTTMTVVFTLQTVGRCNQSSCQCY